jgi:glycosyltransferase involved in cell wall biosynthesis
LLLSQTSPHKTRKRLKVALISSCLPRQCGIATFSASLSQALGKIMGRDSTCFLALNHNESHRYPPEVIFQIERENLEDYHRAAEMINSSAVDLVVLQHEFGLFGGAGGDYIVELLGYLRKPVVTIFHTVLEKPVPELNKAFLEVAAFSQALVVMNGLAIEIMTNTYDLPSSKIHLIPHGVPDTFYIEPSYYKSRMGFLENFVILTFGFLSSNKGIETVLEALPGVVLKHPEVLYLVLGVTHPEVKKHEGESYRQYLQDLVDNLGISRNVKFVNQFVDDSVLDSYLGAADLVICPYHSEEQITSGVLSNSMGKGKAIISTPYLHAKEVLAGGRGILVNFKDSQMMSERILQMVENPQERFLLASRAYMLGQQMGWSRVAKQYAALFEKVVGQPGEKYFQNSRVFTLPELNLSYLKTLTDETSIVQHTIYGVQDYSHYYSADDAGRALAVCSSYYNLMKDETVLSLIDKYMAYLVHAQRSDGWFHNYMNYQREFPEQEHSQDTFGRCLWGLGAVVNLVQDRDQGMLAARLLEGSVALIDSLTYTRAQAYTALGLDAYLLRYPEAEPVQDGFRRLADSLLRCYRKNASGSWKWFEDFLTYDNARLPQALLLAYHHFSEPDYLKFALEALDFLTEVQYQDGYFDLIGNEGWYHRGKEKALYCQQPLDAGALTETFLLARMLTGEQKYLELAYAAFQWYLGRNRLGAPLYESISGSCCDGLGPGGPSKNKGAESTLSFLLGLLAFYQWGAD